MLMTFSLFLLLLENLDIKEGGSLTISRVTFHHFYRTERTQKGNPSLAGNEILAENIKFHS